MPDTPPPFEYVETAAIEEQVAAGPAAIKVIGNAVYIVLYIPHVMHAPEAAEDAETAETADVRRICVRLVMPREGAAKLSRAIDGAILAAQSPALAPMFAGLQATAQH